MSFDAVVTVVFSFWCYRCHDTGRLASFNVQPKVMCRLLGFEEGRGSFYNSGHSFHDVDIVSISQVHPTHLKRMVPQRIPEDP